MITKNEIKNLFSDKEIEEIYNKCLNVATACNKYDEFIEETPFEEFKDNFVELIKNTIEEEDYSLDDKDKIAASIKNTIDDYIAFYL